MLSKKTFDLQQSRRRGYYRVSWMTTHGGRSHCEELRCPGRHGDQLLAILFSEEATLNQPRNRIHPIGTRK
jgi:hypothetical protein